MKGLRQCSLERPFLWPKEKCDPGTTGRITEIVKLEKELRLGTPNLTVSPNGRHLIYSQVDQVSSDIMLVENFE